VPAQDLIRGKASYGSDWLLSKDDILNPIGAYVIATATVRTGGNYYSERPKEILVLLLRKSSIGWNAIDLQVSIAYSDGAPTLPRVCYLQPDIFGAKDPAPQDYVLEAMR